MQENTLNKVLLAYQSDEKYDYYSLVNIVITDGKTHDECLIHTFRHFKNEECFFLKDSLFPYFKEYLDPLQKSGQFSIVSNEIFDNNFITKKIDNRLNKIEQYIGNKVNGDDFSFFNNETYKQVLVNVGVDKYNKRFEIIRDAIFSEYIDVKSLPFSNNVSVLSFSLKSLSHLNNKEWYIPKVKKQKEGERYITGIGFYALPIDDKDYLVYVKEFSDGHKNASLNRVKNNQVNIDFYKSVRSELIGLTIKEISLKTNVETEFSKIINPKLFGAFVISELDDRSFIAKISDKLKKESLNIKSLTAEEQLQKRMYNIHINKYNLDKSIHLMFFKRDEDVYMFRKWKCDDTFHSKWTFINTHLDEAYLERIIKNDINALKKRNDKRSLFISVECPEIYAMLNNINLEMKNISHVEIERFVLDECNLNGYSKIREDLYQKTIEMKKFKRGLGKYIANDDDSEINSLLVYTDASVRDDGEEIHVGYGMVIKTLNSDDYIYQASHKIDKATNITQSSQAEAFAVLEAVNFIKEKMEQGKISKHQRIEIRSDEIFNVALINNERELDSVSDTIRNEIISRIKEEVQDLNFVFKWIKGHASDKANIQADKLACEASDSSRIGLNRTRPKMK